MSPRFLRFLFARLAPIGLLAAVLALGAGQIAQVVAAPPEPVLARQAAGPVSGELDATRVVELPIRANVIGASWHGADADVVVRARSADGWSQWVPLEAEADEGPDRGTEEFTRASKRVTAPLWVGDATSVQLRVREGSPSDLEVIAVNSTGTATQRDRVLSSLQSTAARVLGTPEADAAPASPGIISRSQWGADESLRRGGPVYAPALKAAVVHHTVTSNNYTPAQSASIVRGMYTYHVKGNGWNDIGYNFIVDKYGQVFEGRYGGTTRPVIGAHTMGFNTATTGVSLLGTYSTTAATEVQRDSLRRLLSWRMDLAHVNPAGRTSLRSYGNGKYPAGTTAQVRSVSGHRDLFATACPGDGVYPLIDSDRAAAWAMDGPKFANPRATVTTGPDGRVADIAIRATGNRTLAYTWTLSRTDTGEAVGAVRQTGITLDIRWSRSASAAPLYPWQLRWHLQAAENGVQATPYTRNLSGSTPPPLDLTLLKSRPYYVSPDGDGLYDRLELDFLLNTSASVRFAIERPDGSHVGDHMPTKTLAGWSHRVTFAGRVGSLALPDGTYVARLAASDSRGYSDQVTVPFALDRTLSFPKFFPLVSPDGNKRRDTTAVVVRIKTAASLTVWVQRLSDGALVRTLFSGTAQPGKLSLVFNGRDDAGARLPDGKYYVYARATSAQGTPTWQRPTTIDTRPPRVKARRVNAKVMRVWVSEPARVRGVLRRSNGKRFVRYQAVRKGWTRTSRFPGARFLKVYDQAGNARGVRVR